MIWMSLGFISGLKGLVELLEGAFPTSGEEEHVSILISRALAGTLGLQVGERYVLFGSQGDGATTLIKDRFCQELKDERKRGAR